MNLTAVRKEFFGYAAVRVLTSVLSFIFFTVLTVKVKGWDSSRSVFFLFVLGFLVSGLRLFLQLSSSLQASDPKTRNLSRLYEGVSRTVLVSLILLPLWAYLLHVHTQGLALTVVSVLVVILAGMDVDLYRGLAGKSMLTPVLFALGTLLSLLGALLLPDLGFESSCYLILIQWVPVCVANGLFLIRIVPQLAFAFKGSSILAVLSMVPAGIYDGLVVNWPFLGAVNPESAVAQEVSLVIRVFSSSLPFYPLLLFWANNGTLLKLSHRIKVPQSLLFTLFLFVSSIIVAIVFLAFFRLGSNWQISTAVVTMLVVLLFSFCVYLSAVRFNVSLQSSGKRVLSLLLPLVLFALSVHTLNLFHALSSWSLVASQSSALLLSGIIMTKENKQFTSSL